MALITEREIKELDVDWYCLVNGKPTHIGSMGGMIPKRFREREKLRIIQDAVALIEPFAEVQLNLDGIQKLTAHGYEYLQDQLVRGSVEAVIEHNSGFSYLRDYDLPVRLFASTFVEKARRGFRSFARQEGVEGNEYILIAEPANPFEYKEGFLRLDSLECELSENGNRILFIIDES